MAENSEQLKKLISSFERYYDIKTEGVLSPFSVTAEFHSHSEQYMLVKIAKVAEIDSNDYAYLKEIQTLTDEDLITLTNTAWNDGISKVKPYYSHRNSDVTVVILAQTIDSSTKKLIKKTKFYKSYKFSLYGYSHFRLACKELSSGQIYCNRFGDELRKVLANIN